mmetsp:Transcript_6410/g.17861  ORF Transcript_6410/g.17861 Transcript_6410/m.17861 type:complete len:175 (-) Transcript_6410:412-936(-)
MPGDVLGRDKLANLLARVTGHSAAEDQRRAPQVLFVVEVKCGRRKWRVHRRFSDFQQLHAAVRQSFPRSTWSACVGLLRREVDGTIDLKMPAFPSAFSLTCLSNTDTLMCYVRQQQLDEYLLKLLALMKSNVAKWSDPISSFLELQSSSVFLMRNEITSVPEEECEDELDINVH